MNLQDQVTSLELSKKLKDLGVEQESYFSWSYSDVPDEWSINFGFPRTDSVAAFTVAELGEMLHPHAYSIKKPKGGYTCCWWGEATEQQILRENKATQGYTSEARTEADARAKMLIYLLENNLLPL